VADECGLYFQEEPKDQLMDPTFWADEAKLNQLRRLGIRFAKIRLQGGDIYCIPRRVVHQFQTVSGCISVTWHLKYTKYYQKEKEAPAGDRATDSHKDESEVPSQGKSSRAASPAPAQRKRPFKKANSPMAAVDSPLKEELVSPTQTAPPVQIVKKEEPKPAPTPAPSAQAKDKKEKEKDSHKDNQKEKDEPKDKPMEKDSDKERQKEKEREKEKEKEKEREREREANLDLPFADELPLNQRIVVKLPQPPAASKAPNSPVTVKEAAQKPIKKPKKHWDDEDDEDMTALMNLRKNSTTHAKESNS